MNKHTPGPWVDAGAAVCAAYKGQGGEANQLIQIAHLPHPDEFEKDEWQANADLISAAPDLLEACQSVVQAYMQFQAECLADGWPKLEGEAEAVTKCRIAVAKATGEAA